MSLPTTEPITPIPTPPPAAAPVPQAPAKPEAVQTPDPKPEDALRAPGLKALETERERAKKAESQLAALEACRGCSPPKGRPSSRSRKT